MSVAGASGLMAAALLLSRALGLVRDAIISASFGIDSVRDAYQAAFTIPDLLFYLVAGGALSSAFIPVFTRHWSQGEHEDAWKVFSAIVTVMGIAIVAFIVVAEIFALPLINLLTPGLPESVQPVGAVRTAFVNALSPLLLDVAIAGENQADLSVLAFPSVAACRSLIGDHEAKLSIEEVLRHPDLQRALREKAAVYNRQYPGNSTQIARLLLLATPPDIDAGETTDKGYLNQRTTLRRRADKVAELYAGGGNVIELA